MRKKLYFFFKNNLETFKTFFKRNIYNVSKFKKIFKKISKFSQHKLCLIFEFFLYNVLLKSHFAVTQNDAIYLIKNNYVFVNGTPQCNVFYEVKLYDRVQIPIFSIYFLYSVKKFNDLNILVTKNKSKMLRYFRSKKRIFMNKTNIASDKNQKLMYYNMRIPNYLEVDYTLMLSVVINLPFDYKHFNYYYFKYLPIYLNRSFLWRLVS